MCVIEKMKEDLLASPTLFEFWIHIGSNDCVKVCANRFDNHAYTFAREKRRNVADQELEWFSLRSPL